MANEHMSPEDQRAVRNSIFAAAQAQQNPSQQPTAPAGSPIPQGYQPNSSGGISVDLPVVDVPLPSCGLVYELPPLRGMERVDIKAMTSTEEDILMNRVLIRKGTAISELIKSCIIDRNIDLDTMISGDRDAIMIAIRITGYGADYTPKLECPKCEAMQEFPVNLTDLNIKSLDLSSMDQVDPFTNRFRFVLPMTQKTVEFKFLTGRDQEKILAETEAKKKKGILSENTVTSRLLSTILSVDGDSQRGHIADFCKKMPARDSLALRKHIDSHEPGVDMTSDFTCVRCGHVEVVGVALGVEFFWPNARG